MATYTDRARAEAGGGLSRTVLHYSDVMKQLVDQAKQPGFTVNDWGPLAEMVAVDEFERVGAFKEVMTWRDYVEFLTKWATSSEWECSFKRITELPGLVYLELEERSLVDGRRNVANSCSVYEFDAAGKLRRLFIYLQRD